MPRRSITANKSWVELSLSLCELSEKLFRNQNETP